MSLVRYVNLRVPAGAARPGPAIGQALGPLGINMAEFCKQFNEQTESVYVKEAPLGVRLAALSDRTFTFDIRSPPTSHLVLQASTILHHDDNTNSSNNNNNNAEKRGPNKPSPERIHGTITPEAIYEIAKIKQKDDLMWHLPLESLAKSVIGTAKSMGIQVKEEQQQQQQEEVVVPP
uniref:Ribosomal protein L11 C-terminal domain-containing protein n=1 Tax=Cyclophora tenuis TaxID=216820 RepID=A0A7S1GJX5_CYCTE|mmetsp:Transcript_16067/g.27204  ORF Transcript_16067/g.27204 Transcript_16067/m.27204 type:complete len:177 (+) Transcript_16067:39-569(+)